MCLARFHQHASNPVPVLVAAGCRPPADESLWPNSPPWRAGLLASCPPQGGSLRWHATCASWVCSVVARQFSGMPPRVAARLAWLVLFPGTDLRRMKRGIRAYPPASHPLLVGANLNPWYGHFVAQVGDLSPLNKSCSLCVCVLGWRAKPSVCKHSPGPALYGERTGWGRGACAKLILCCLSVFGVPAKPPWPLPGWPEPTTPSLLTSTKTAGMGRVFHLHLYPLGVRVRAFWLFGGA